MSLKRRQELFLDGIDTSFQMTQMAYQRLCHAVLGYSQAAVQSDSRTLHQNAILLYSWALVDTINRLRVLVMQTPGLKRDAPVKSFLRTTQDVEALRNFVQHLPGEVMALADTGRPIWGSLSWLWVPPDTQPPAKIESVLLVPGTLATSKGYQMVNPAGKTFRTPVDHITLSAGDTRSDLSEVTRSSLLFAQRFQAGVERARRAQDKRIASDPDVFLQIALECEEDSQVTD